jgi:hypothetical protein
MVGRGSGNNPIGSVLNDSLPRLGIYPREVAHDPGIIKESMGMFSEDGYKWMPDGMLNHSAVDDVFHGHEVFKTAMDVAKGHIESEGIEPFRNKECMSEELWKNVVLPHRYAELSFCLPVYQENPELPHRITEWKSVIDTTTLANALYLVFENAAAPEKERTIDGEVGRIRGILEDNFEHDPHQGKAIVDFMEEHGDGFRYILSEIGLDSRSAWEGFIRDVTTKTGNCLKAVGYQG